MRVLAADDDEQLRDILVRFFARLGVESLVVSSGEEAFSAYKDASRDPKGRFDAVFADLGMPWRRGDRLEDGGRALARAIRAEEKGAGCGCAILVALTGADSEDSADLADAGFDRVMQKPVGLEDVAIALGLR